MLLSLLSKETMFLIGLSMGLAFVLSSISLTYFKINFLVIFLSKYLMICFNDLSKFKSR